MLWVILIVLIMFVPAMLFIFALAVTATHNEEHAQQCCDELERRQA